MTVPPATTDEFVRYMHDRRRGPPPNLTIDPSVLTDAIKAIGRLYYLHVRRNDAPAPTEVHADLTTWQTLDEVSVAVYGMPLAHYLGRQWWPTAKPAKSVQRIVVAGMEPQTFRVA